MLGSCGHVWLLHDFSSQGMEDGREAKMRARITALAIVCCRATLSLDWRHGDIRGHEGVINPDRSCSVLEYSDKSLT